MPTTRTLPPADVDRSIRIRAARACFVSAIGAAMLANVAGGIAPRWWRRAPVGAFDRWDAFDHLDGLLSVGAGDAPLGCAPGTQSRELRECLEDARPLMPEPVLAAGFTLADTLDACRE